MLTIRGLRVSVSGLRVGFKGWGLEIKVEGLQRCMALAGGLELKK